MPLSVDIGQVPQECELTDQILLPFRKDRSQNSTVVSYWQEFPCRDIVSKMGIPSKGTFPLSTTDCGKEAFRI